MKFFYVFLGGGFGSMLRLSIVEIFSYYSIKQTFLATMLANVLSSLLFGIILGVELRHGLSDNAKAMFLIGICGGFSTFSSFAGETFFMMEGGEYMKMISYIVLSFVISWIAIFAGMKMV
ncbi:MAG: CrcB family protein [Saprospiraceae bacterium]